MWDQHKDDLDAIIAAVDQGSELLPDTSATVPHALVVAASGVAEASRRANFTARQRFSVLVLGRLEVGRDPSVTLFFNAVKAFEGRRHPSRARKVTLDEETLPKLEEALQTIETVLEARLGSFFDSLDDVMDILEIANRRVGPNADE
ncbi:hypothetical protein A5620_12970 [Mycobacterium colombiense]|nr:hypothetical protein A5620_12970 [Mycobacterium colombiense]